MSSKLAKLIKDARVKAGLSQYDLAKILGISRPAITAWENGTALPKRQYTAALAKALNLSPNTIDPLSFVGTVEKVDLGVENFPILILNSCDVPHKQGLAASMDAILSPIASGKLLVGSEYQHCYALEIVNAEMAPDYLLGDTVIVDPTLTMQNGDEVVISMPGKPSVIRRVLIRGQDETGFTVFDLTTPNVHIPTVTVTRETDAYVQGVIVEHRRKKRRSSSPPPPRS